MSHHSAHGIYSEETSGVRRILLSQGVFWCVAGGIRKHTIQLSEKMGVQSCSTTMLLSFALEKFSCAQNMVKPKAGEKSLILPIKVF